MGAVAGWARTGSRWTCVLLAVFAGLAAGAGMFAVAGWSRTRGALPAFERFAPSADAAVSVDSPTPDDPQVLEQVVKSAGANASLMIADVAVSFYRPDGTVAAIGAVVSPVPVAGTLDRGRVVAGREADPTKADELTMNEAAAADLHVHAGSKIDVGIFAASQAGRTAPGGEPMPLLGRVPMTVTGIVRYTADLERQPNAKPGTEFATADDRVSLSDGFWGEYGSRVAVDFLGVAVKLPDGAAGFDRLANAATQGFSGRFNASLGDNFVPNRSALVRTIDLQGAALLAVGLLGALVGAVFVAQAIARHVTFRAVDHRTLVTIGMTRRQVVAGEVLTVVPAAIGALVVAAIVAVSLSPLTPVGVARDAELSPGIDVDWLVVLVGGVAIVVYVLAIAAIAAWTSGRVHSERVARPSWLRSRLAGASAPPPIVAGSDFALSRQGRASAAVQPALAALSIGLLVVVGAWVVQGSLSQLLDRPAERGWSWDAQAGLITSEDSATAGAAALDHDVDVAGYAGQLGGVFVPIDGRSTPVTVLDPHGAVAGPIVLEGRAPTAADEIAVGRQTLAALHKHVGDLVAVSSPQGQVVQLRIVGTVVPLSAVDALESFGDGALIPIATARMTAGPGQPLIPSSYLVTFRQGVDRGAALARLEQLFPRTVLVAPSSVDVDTLRRVDWLPVALAGLVGLLTAGTLAHVIITSVRRHRRDFGVLQAIGFTNAQIGAVVQSMALVVSIVMLVIGVPIGIAAGRVAWTIVAGGLGTTAGPHVPTWLLVIVPATIGVGALTALLPAWRTVRRLPAEALRQE